MARETACETSFSETATSTLLQAEEPEIPDWALSMDSAFVKNGFVHGFVATEDGLDTILALHGRATVSDFVKRYLRFCRVPAIAKTLSCSLWPTFYNTFYVVIF